LADRILGIHVDFENQCADNKNKINSGLSVAREKCDRLSQESSTIMDLQRIRGEHLSANKAQTEELFKRVSISRQTVCITVVQDSKSLSNFCDVFFSPLP
jgi:hypothetical protein